MDTSLSIIIPVRDAEGAIARNLLRWLELLPEFTSRFELILVDDGSVDQTVEIALELARQYPQLRVCRSPRLGPQQALRTGLRQAQGEVVFVQDELGAVSGNDLKKLWELRRDPQLAAARTPPKGAYYSDALVNRLTAWGEALKAQPVEPAAGVQLLRREAAAEAGEVTRADTPHPAVAARPGNGFLRHLRNLALGE